jgi:hypothetical protein
MGQGGRLIDGRRMFDRAVKKMVKETVCNAAKYLALFDTAASESLGKRHYPQSVARIRKDCNR